MKRLVIAAAGMAALVSPQAGADRKPSKEEIESIAATPEVAASTVEIIDDPYKSVISLSSRGFYGSKNPAGDQFLRAFVDRKTRAVTYQLYVTRTYSGSGWRHYASVSALGKDGPIEMKADRVDTDVRCYRYSCSYFEAVVAEVPAQLIASAAVGASGGTGDVWKWKLFSGIANTFDGDEAGLLKTEVAGMQIAINRLLARLDADAPHGSAQP